MARRRALIVAIVKLQKKSRFRPRHARTGTVESLAMISEIPFTYELRKMLPPRYFKFTGII